MRGGAIPLLAWGAGLAVLMAINAIWTGDGTQIAEFGFAVLVVLASGASEERVDEALDAAAGDARVALVSLLAGVDADDARSRLEASEGSVRKAAGQ